MGTTDYAGKSAYRGEIAARYESDRKTEPLWVEEQNFVGRWAATLPEGATILDLPAGTGRFVELLLERKLRVMACDISDDMLAEIRKRAAVNDPSLTIAKADAERLAMADKSVDFVLCWRLFHLLPIDAIERVLGEFRRVCRKEIVVQVLPVRSDDRVGGVLRAWRKLLRPLRRWGRPSKRTPWAHIPSRVHVERDLLAAFSRARVSVGKVETMAKYDGLPVRVYTLVPEN